MSTEYRNFLALSYDELEELNLAAKADRMNRVAADEIREKRIKYLTDEKRIKAVTVLFSDLEGRLHLLDYDKKFLLGAYENLTFDGSSIRGFTAQKESDLRLGIDWSAFYWVPADVFGNGKDAERHFHETGKFEFINTGGYYHVLPLDPLRQFIDTSAEVQRAMGFQNEKDHPEVAPSQFEINYGYGEVVAAADQIQLYKLLTRQVANNMGFTASFLPKPVVGVNGSGMHTNVSISEGKTNLFWDPEGQEKLSAFGWDFIDRILTHALDICLILNPSVNAYRRLDPHFEAPNQIKASATDRGSMVRVPIGNSRSMRVEVRSVAPDANPYLTLYSIFKTGIDGTTATIDNLRQAQRYLPDHIQAAIDDFKASTWIAEILGADVQGRFADLKQAAANRSPRELGTFVKGSEVQYHHEVYNQSLWNNF